MPVLVSHNSQPIVTYISCYKNIWKSTFESVFLSDMYAIILIKE